MKIRWLLLLFVFFCFCKIKAQEVTISDELTIRSDQSYSIIGKLEDKLLLYRDKNTEFEIQAYDELLRLSWKKELELDKKRPEVLGVIGFGAYFCVIYKYRNKGYTIVKAHKYDAAANLVDSTLIVNYGKRFYAPEPEIVLSENRKNILVYHTEYFAEIEVTSFSLDSMEVLWEKNYNPPGLEYGREFHQVLVDNKGGMHMILIRENDRLKKDRPHYFEILYQSKNVDVTKVVKIELQGKLSYDAYFKVDNFNQALVAGGMYSEKHKARTQGHYYLKIPITDSDDYILSFREYEEDFKEQLVNKKTKVDKGLFDVGIQDIVLRQDGGLLLICEQRKEYERRSGNYTRSYYVRESGRYVVDHYYEDLFIFSVHPDGAFHWETILHKKQFSQDDDAAYSSFFLVKTPIKLRLIYNDEIRNENTVSEYVIKGNGHYDRNSILNTANQGLKLRFRESQQVALNEVVVPSERKNKLKLVRVLF